MKKLSLALLPFMVAMTSAQAESAFDPQGQYLLGDWDGKRTELAQQGIKFEANILTDTAYLAEGGRNEGADPLTSAQLWLGTQLDMEKLAGWDGVTVRAVATARQGQSTSVRDLQGNAPHMANVQGTFGRGNQDSRLSELSIEKTFKDQGLSIKAGRLGLGMDFNVMACDFASTAFCAAQMGKWQGNIWMNTPVSQWGARVKQQVNPEVAVQVGVYEFNPDNGNGKAEGQGWSLNTDHADGVTIPAEVVWTPKSFVNGLPGSYRIGGMYNTADDIANQKDIATGEGKNRTFAGWLAIEQQLTSTGSGRQGLHSFANFTWHDRDTNKVDNSQQIGVKYIGLADSQPNDILGLAVNSVHVNDRFADSRPAFDASAEYNIELNYSYNATKWLMLRPNLQYVVNPGSSNQVDNALVLGLTTRVIF
ncbi:carbohydrate porin [Acinetobacter sp. ACNIH3]|jgi:porin|uniref:carbohydrate porin n=1 Tax=unclassified Acinetobacter TaxID=196816 RepID=UPI000CDDE5C9|nr:MULTISPECIES: carbohydrate porin [unclassified Acinetobacter]POU24351.1 carbohydrate porin [Acinetobacter sp. ACNIH3]POV77805.1 carbohydrate porin [Acinetobacter sp. ACNIH4]